ncbi:MAG TPA: GTPase [Candidatus Latescibacteria bacterium]|nr:50S ribosome-binding GTPase [Candidatus Latescibacterota bacterium]HJP29466.1 GTPase [Candidatus Latescibacterota bacterium]
MPMPARHLWSHIQKQLRGRPEPEQLRLLRGHLDDLHDEWKGPYKDLRDRLRRQVSRLEGHDAVRSRSGQHDPFHVKRQGEAMVVFAGAPNAGKSALVGALTGAATTVADYPFATQHPAPGMLAGDGGALQLVDTPPVVPGLAAGEGPGKPLLHLFSIADALAVVVDVADDPVARVQTLFAELDTSGVRPVAGPVGTVISSKGKGGVRFSGHTLDRAQEQTARGLVEAAHIDHAEIAVRTTFDAEQLRLQLDGDILLPTIFLATRSGLPGADAGRQVLGEHWPELPVLAADADQPDSLGLRTRVLDSLGRISVQLLERAAVDAAGSTVLTSLASDVAAVVTRTGDQSRLKGARVWGTSVDRPGQSVSLQHIVEAGDRIFVQS